VVRQPELNEKESFRTIKFVPPEEIELAVRNLIQGGFSILEDEVVKQVARIFGFDRTGLHIYDRIKGILKQMISRGDLILKGDRLSLPFPPYEPLPKSEYAKIVIDCPKCLQKLRLPSGRHLRVTCPKCKHVFDV